MLLHILHPIDRHLKLPKGPAYEEADNLRRNEESPDGPSLTHAHALFKSGTKPGTRRSTRLIGFVQTLRGG